MREKIQTVIIGAGQAGLAVSRHLVEASRDHVILERGRVAERWRSERWDSFTMLSPNWYAEFPGYGRPTHDPDGFMTRDQVIRFLEAYAESFGAPVRTGVEVETVEPAEEPRRLLVRCAQGRTINAAQVVVAAGPTQEPVIPRIGRRLPADVLQVHSSRYRNPRQLPPGAVLVVGTGASGQQIAEELSRSGRRVYLSVGRYTEAPRRYRGKDCAWWLDRLGDFDQTVTSLEGDRSRAGTPDLGHRRPILSLDLEREGILTVIWATGFRTDLSWIRLPVFSAAGEPRHVRGVTAHPGLFFIGLHWLYKFQSAFIRGVAEDAAYIADRLLAEPPGG